MLFRSAVGPVSEPDRIEPFGDDPIRSLRRDGAQSPSAALRPAGRLRLIVVAAGRAAALVLAARAGATGELLQLLELEFLHFFTPLQTGFVVSRPSMNIRNKIHFNLKSFFMLMAIPATYILVNTVEYMTHDAKYDEIKS